MEVHVIELLIIKYIIVNFILYIHNVILWIFTFLTVFQSQNYINYIFFFWLLIMTKHSIKKGKGQDISFDTICSQMKRLKLSKTDKISEERELQRKLSEKHV